MARGLLSDRSELEVLFEELAEELARLSSSTEVVMVGGCALVLVDDNGRCRRFDQIDRRIAGALQKIGTIERQERAILQLRQRPQQRGLADLARPRQDHDTKCRHAPSDNGGYETLELHAPTLAPRTTICGISS